MSDTAIGRLTADLESAVDPDFIIVRKEFLRAVLSALDECGRAFEAVRFHLANLDDDRQCAQALSILRSLGWKP